MTATGAATGSPAGDRRRPLRPIERLSGRQVNLLLAVSSTGVLVTGLVSWTVGTGWGRWFTALHGVLGVLLVVLAPAKIRRSVRPGLRRGRPERWLSVTLGILLLVTVGLGFASSSGLWTGVGTGASLWWHVLVAGLTVPLLLWHVGSRPVKPHRVDTDRRLVLGGLTAAGAAAATVGVTEVGIRAAGLAGADRRFTGSHEIASFNPSRLPRVSWLDDTAPAVTDAIDWTLTLDGVAMPIADLAARARPLVAVIDCTGGWWSEQRWDVVPLAELIDDGVLDGGGRSLAITSATGYARIFPRADADSTFLAVGYDGRPLLRGHGAPVRVVAPARRGPWWVKWVTSVEATSRPWWLQLPLPPT